MQKPRGKDTSERKLIKGMSIEIKLRAALVVALVVIEYFPGAAEAFLGSCPQQLEYSYDSVGNSPGPRETFVLSNHCAPRQPLAGCAELISPVSLS